MKLAIDIHRRTLLNILAALVAMVGDGETVARHLHSAVLSVLRPAEAALRRLIAVAAVGLVAVPQERRVMPTGRIPRGNGGRTPSFPLFDKRKNVDPKDMRVGGFGPNIRGTDGTGHRPPVVQPPAPDDAIDAARLHRRLASMAYALGNMSGQARRLSRALARPSCKWLRVMRPGRPPGHRAMLASGRWRHPVDEVLSDCHELALYALHHVDLPAPES